MFRTMSIGGCNMFEWYMWRRFENSGKIEDYLLYCEEKACPEERTQQPVDSGERAANL